jgi:hypothetical protein
MTDRDTVVVSDGGSSSALILGFLAIVIVIAAVWFFAFGPGAGAQTGTDEGPTINIEVPSVPPAE